MSVMHQILFGLYPYMALTIFILGSLVRYDKDQFSWRTGSSQMLSGRGFRMASNLFHIGIIMIFFGHFAGLVIPYSFWHLLGFSLETKQIIAMTVGGFFGGLCFIGLTMLVIRRLFNPRVRASSSLMDTTILLILYLQLILGLVSIGVSAGHMDGLEMQKLMGWANAIVRLNPTHASSLMIDTHWIFQVHILLGMTVFVLFPFSRLVHVWSIPFKYIRRNYQVVRRKA